MRPPHTPLTFLIVQETDWLLRGPHQQHHLFERLAQRGHKVVVLDFEIMYVTWPREPLIAHRHEWGSVSRVLPQAQVRVIRPGTVRLPGLARSLSIITFYRELNTLAHILRPDLIVDYAVSTGVPALAISRHFEIPFVMHVIDALHTLVPSKFLQPIARAIERSLLRAADRTIFINQELEDYGVNHGAKPERAHTIGSGVDLKLFHPNTNAEELRRELGFVPQDVVLIFVGWLYDFSGIDTIMQNLAELPTNVKLLVVGTGDAEKHLRELHQSMPLGERVEFVGRQPYDLIPRFIAASDVCVMYSELNEVTRHIIPIKIYEYMASGKPVISSQLPGVMREVPPGNGVLYALPDQLLKTMNRLLVEETRLLEGNRARAFAEAHCDWEKLTDDFEDLLVSATTTRLHSQK